MKKVLVFIFAGLLAGCAGRLYTIKDPQPGPNGRINGLIVYQPKSMVLITETTEAEDGKGNIIGSSKNKTCQPVQSFEIVTGPDYSKPYAVGYDAALFESHTFSLELDKGVVTKVNYESTSGAKETLDALSGALGVAKDVMAGGAKFKATEILPEESKTSARKCNVGKKIIASMDLCDIPKKVK
ncbi:MAG: hypothetical protein WC417_07155 [Candidatus Omnitrophota bacterium]|jgi:hypothetical protein